MKIETKKVKWCDKDYVKISDLTTSKLVNRIEAQKVNEIQTVSIGFVISNFTGYCPYCYNGIQDYDEIWIDCGGDNCPACGLKVKRAGFDLLAPILWAALGILIISYIIYFYVYNKNKEDKLHRKIKELEKKGFEF